MAEIEYAGLLWALPRSRPELQAAGLSAVAAERLWAQLDVGHALSLVGRDRSGVVGLVALRDWGPSPRMREAMVAAALGERQSLNTSAGLCLCWSIAHGLIGLEQLVIMRRREDLTAQDLLRRLLPGAREREVGPAWVLVIEGAPSHYREPDSQAARALADLVDSCACVTGWRRAGTAPPPRRPGIGAAGIAGVLEGVRRRTETANVSDGVHVPVAPPPAAAAHRPVVSEVVLTAEGLAGLQEEHRRLIGPRRAEVADRLKVAREMGSVADDGEYEDALREQQALEAEILRTEERLARARIAEARDDGRAGIGSRLRVLEAGTEREYLLVGAFEADPTAGRISIESPLGAVLRGTRAGDLASLEAPKGTRRIEVVTVS